MRKTRLPLVALLLVNALLLNGCGASPGEDPVLISCAASLGEALKHRVQEIGSVQGRRARLNVAGSQTVARQITAGQRADLVFLANRKWMTYLRNRNVIVPSSRTVFLSNRLVFVAHASETEGTENIDKISSYKGKIALGNPHAVPAGIYARKALKSLEVWSTFKHRVVSFPHVRAALQAVASGNVRRGIVYRTDARRLDELKIAATIPASQTPSIAYEAALIEGHSPAAEGWYDRLLEPRSLRYYEQKGFEIPKT